jgi:hypothetical protein
MNWDLLSNFISGLAGGGVLLLVSGIFVRSLMADVRDLKREVHTDLKKNVEHIAGKLERLQSGCNGAEHGRRIVSLEDRMKAQEFESREVGRKIEGMQTTLSNQITAFRDFSARLAHYMEETTKQRAEIDNLKSYLDDVATDARNHARDRELHHG